MLLFSLVLMVLAALALWGLLWWQVAQLRRDGLSATTKRPAWSEYCQHELDHYYQRFGWFFKQLAHGFYFYLLVGLKSVAVFTRYLLWRVEGKCGHLIETMHRHSSTAAPSAASSFLHQIKQHKDKILTARLQAD